MQHIKGKEMIGILKEVAHMDGVLTDSLARVIDKIDIGKLGFGIKVKERLL